MFKKTLLGAAIAAATLVSGAANAYMIGDPNDANVEVYGVVSISAVNYGSDKYETAENGGHKVTDEGWVLENETRVGFRAAKAMTDSVEAFVQMESGWMGDMGADIGNRDTFVGVRGDDWGTVRFGRMLTPMYELVDWPYSASNMGTTFDRGWRAGERFTFDRQSQQVRFDSKMYADTVKFSLSVGNAAKNEDSNFAGGSVSVTPIDMLTLHAAFEIANEKEFDTNSVGDTNAYFGGFALAPMDNFNILGAYKVGSYDKVSGTSTAYDEREISAFSIQANYFMGDMNFRLGYADQTGDTDGQTDHELDFSTITSEVGYSFNSVYTFVRVAQHSGTFKDNNVAGQSYDDLMVRFGTEWTF